MKANEAKRKIFTDAVDLIGGGESEVSGANCVEMLDIDAIKPMKYAKFHINHKHRFSHPYHQHGRGNSLRQAIKSIQSHDRWQMNGRHR